MTPGPGSFSRQPVEDVLKFLEAILRRPSLCGCARSVSVGMVLPAERLLRRSEHVLGACRTDFAREISRAIHS